MASPDVITKEIDQTYSTSSDVTNVTGFIGRFRWGPVNDIELVSTSEDNLVKKFHKPTGETARDFLSATNYLLYASPLAVVRVVGPAAKNAVPPTKTALALKNFVDYDTATLTGYSFIGRYMGVLGNSLKISVANSVGYSTWAYKSSFSYKPADANTFNVAVIDVDGTISGTVGKVIETFELMTKTVGSTKTDGTTAYIKQAIEDQSAWLYFGDTAAIVFTDGLYEVTLQGGADDNVIANADWAAGVAVFKADETIEPFRYFTAEPTAQDELIDMADSRMDGFVCVAPPLDAVYNVVDPEESIVAYYDTTLNKNTSYGFPCDNWKLVYDKYRDVNVWIPCSSDLAGLHARCVANNEVWTSPAGLNRGQLKNVIRLAYNSSKDQRDILWESNINSITSFRGQGIVLWGDKTLYKAPSAFSHINVRSLFIQLRKDIASDAKYLLFEINDDTTRTLFKNSTDAYLTTVQTRGGLYGFKVVCDSTNNTADVIDGNEFVGDIYLKPSRSINTIRLNFVAVATSVSFEES